MRPESWETPAASTCSASSPEGREGAATQFPCTLEFAAHCFELPEHRKERSLGLSVAHSTFGHFPAAEDALLD